MSVTIREFETADYQAVRRLWEEAEGVQLVDPDEPGGVDSPEGIAAFLARNPGLSFVAEEVSPKSKPSRLVGAIMTGTDGRRGFLHHLAVTPEHRNAGVGTRLVHAAIAALSQWGIVKTHLFVVATNDTGAQFWSNRGWQRRDDLHMYSLNHRPAVDDPVVEDSGDEDPWRTDPNIAGPSVADESGMSYTER
jgi:ribosomal protein S18 acetylase RimI-like enzyme